MMKDTQQSTALKWYADQFFTAVTTPDLTINGFYLKWSVYSLLFVILVAPKFGCQGVSPC